MKKLPLLVLSIILSISFLLAAFAKPVSAQAATAQEGTVTTDDALCVPVQIAHHEVELSDGNP